MVQTDRHKQTSCYFYSLISNLQDDEEIKNLADRSDEVLALINGNQDDLQKLKSSVIDNSQVWFFNLYFIILMLNQIIIYSDKVMLTAG